jgi:hypothetical protein
MHYVLGTRLPVSASARLLDEVRSGRWPRRRAAGVGTTFLVAAVGVALASGESGWDLVVFASAVGSGGWLCSWAMLSQPRARDRVLSEGVRRP